MTIDPEEIAAWRRKQRRALIAAREAIPKPQLHQWRLAIDRHLQRGFPGLCGITVALCWPYRNEYDARHLAAQLRRSGSNTALPVVIAPDAPLQFRDWRPGVAMVKGTLGIPYPRDTPLSQPRVVLLPMVGFDAQGYRLGYGGGYFDRTLAVLTPRPAVIGVAHELARIETIYPQSHDIAVDYLVTERGIYRRNQGKLEFLAAPEESENLPLASPVCFAHAPENRRERDD